MVRLVNRLTGTEMWVHEDRLKEYLAAGHTRPAAPEAPAPAQEEPEEPPKRKRSRKER